MSFSAPEGNAAPAAAPVAKPSFGDEIMKYMQSQYPVAGGLAHLAFGGGQPQTPAPTPAPMGAVAPPLDTGAVAPPDYSSMIQANAQPKQGGGLSTLLKLLAG